MNKLPCATCPDMCENAVGLYKAYHLAKEYKETKDKDAQITSMGLKCPKTGLYMELTQEKVNE